MVLWIARTIVLRELVRWTVDALIIVLQGHVVGHVVDAQQKSEMIGRMVVIVEVKDLSALGLHL